MRQKHPPSTSPQTADSTPAESLLPLTEDWFLDCELRQLSPYTLANRRIFGKPGRFLKNNLSLYGVHPYLARVMIHFGHRIIEGEEEGLKPRVTVLSRHCGIPQFVK